MGLKKLEIGPHISGKIDKTWETMDIKPASHVDIVADLCSVPLPIKDETYDLVYASHVLEHIPWFNTVKILTEINRIIKPGGTAEFWVPDLDKLIAGYKNNSLIAKDGWYKYNPDKDPIVWLNGRIFTYGPDEANWHRAVFNESHLKKCLAKAGFRNVKRLEKPRGIGHGWINLGVGGQK